MTVQHHDSTSQHTHTGSPAKPTQHKLRPCHHDSTAQPTLLKHCDGYSATLQIILHDHVNQALQQHWVGALAASLLTQVGNALLLSDFADNRSESSNCAGCRLSKLCLLDNEGLLTNTARCAAKQANMQASLSQQTHLLTNSSSASIKSASTSRAFRWRSSPSS